jgi:hypothetical protein
MKVWLISVAALFVLAEIYLWVKDFILPFPIYILGGAFLAIASNYEQGIVNFFQQKSEKIIDPLRQTATLVDKTDILESRELSIGSLTHNKHQSQSEIDPKTSD